MIHLVKFILQNMNNIEESSQNQKGKNSFIFPIEFGNLQLGNLSFLQSFWNHKMLLSKLDPGRSTHFQPYWSYFNSSSSFSFSLFQNVSTQNILHALPLQADSCLSSVSTQPSLCHSDYLRQCPLHPGPLLLPLHLKLLLLPPASFIMFFTHSMTFPRSSFPWPRLSMMIESRIPLPLCP